MADAFTSVTLDYRGFNAGMAAAQEWTKRTPARVCNSAALAVSIGARNRMPAVPVSTMDSELAVGSLPMIGKRGKPLKRKKAYFGKVGTSSTTAEVPLAVLIIAARGRYTSRYNKLTNFRYALFGSPFKGVSRAAGQAQMRQLVHEMIASRHKSGSFLKAGWGPAISKLRTKAYYAVPGFDVDITDLLTSRDTSLGEAKAAIEGETNVSAVIINDIGGSGQNAESMNQALNRYGLPGLQAALDDEGTVNMNYALKKSEQDLAARFNSEFR